VRIIEKIRGMDAKELASLETNAKNLVGTATGERKAEAERVLAAIAEERIRRTSQERERRRAARRKIAESVRDRSFFDRVVLAFDEHPPADWEVEALRVVAEHPGANFNDLARHIGKRDGGYMNLAMGTLCAEREHYLGVAPPSSTRKGEKFYSGLLIHLEQHVEDNGSVWHGWFLKPEAEAALRHLGILGAAVKHEGGDSGWSGAASPPGAAEECGGGSRH
jgi:hypothetical protein